MKSLLLGQEQSRGLVSNSEMEIVGQGKGTSALSHCISIQKTEGSMTSEEVKKGHGAGWVSAALSQLAVVTTLPGCALGLCLPWLHRHSVAGPRLYPMEMPMPGPLTVAGPSGMIQKSCIVGHRGVPTVEDIYKPLGRPCSGGNQAS